MSERAMEFDEWPSLCRLLRSYTERKYATLPTGLTIHFAGEGRHHEPIPPKPDHTEPPTPPSLAEWGSGDDPKHSGDFSLVYWPVLGSFRLTPKQRVIVGVLWTAMDDGRYDVHTRELLQAADSDCMRLHDLFFKSAAWKKRLIVPGLLKGTYRLAPLPSLQAERRSLAEAEA